MELKPETAILEPRWNAAVKTTKKLSAADIRSLLRLLLFSDSDPEFAKRFTEGLVKAEPTFPPNHNTELLRVMAAAAVFSQLENPSSLADALALGLQAADFPQGRLETVFQDVMTRAAQYLAAESERIRPKINAGALAEAEKQAEAHFAALKKAVETNAPQEIGKATEAATRGVLSAMKESHLQLGDVVDRIAEESQFLWWLIGRRSPAINVRREQLTAAAYALPAAAEAAERVTELPPALSVESLLDEVLTQCAKGGPVNALMVDLIAAADFEWVKRVASSPAAPALVPISALLATRLQDGKLDASLLKKLGVGAKAKFTPIEAARQYFRELMFIRAVVEAG